MPEPTPTATAAGQATPTDADRDRIRRLVAAVDEIGAAAPTVVRNDDPSIPSWREGSRIGSTPAVQQPGIPPQGRAAVDYAVRVLSTSVATALFSGSISLVMVVSHWADPVVCGIVFGAPIGLAVPIAAVSSLLGKAKQVVEAAPAEVHNHFNGPVHQDQRTTQSRNTGVWVKNTNPQ